MHKTILRFAGLLWLLLLAFLCAFYQLGQAYHSPLLAYVLNSGYENADIMLADVSSDISINLSNDEYPNGNPHWSMDGRYLVFRSSRDIYWTFFVLDTENWQIRELIAFDYDVSISSAGDHGVIFSTIASQIVINIETGEEISLEEFFLSCVPPECLNSFDSPVYYPYQLELSLVDDAIFVELVDIDWSTTDLNTLSQQMRWSVDGESFIFRTDIQGQSDLYLGTLEGGLAQRLTNSPEIEDTLAWSGDKRWISFTRLINGYTDVFVLELATGQITNISQSPRSDAHPIWQH